MNEKITSLLKLQEIDLDLDKDVNLQAQLAPKREKLKAEFAALQAQAEEAKKTFTQAQVDRKNLELDIESKDQAVRKSSSELNSVKSNDAYKALLTQIEDAKKAKSELEDKVLELMEKMDGLQKQSKDAEKKLVQDKALFDQKSAELDAEEARLKGELEGRKKSRDEFALSLPADIRDLYESTRRGRRGMQVLVPIKAGNTCGGCRMTLPPNVVNQVLKRGELVSCESCTRILYILPKAASNASVPAEGASEQGSVVPTQGA